MSMSKSTPTTGPEHPVFRRIILIVLDGVGVGALPDAADYGDQDAATLQHVAVAVGGLDLPRMEQLGLGNIAAISGVGEVDSPSGCWGKMVEKSAGKDSITGHWELAGVILDHPFAVYPQGFPAAIIADFVSVTGLRPLGNIAASGTEILKEFGEEHLRTGRPIVYTSSDSVFQIAAHEDVIPPEQLYTLCRKVEKALLPYNICRVIARPFRGKSAADFYRTAGRHDFPRKPAGLTLLDLLTDAGITVRGIGKIGDLFAGQGLSESFPTRDNRDGMATTLRSLVEFEDGLIMVNLVDFDMHFGHRLDSRGFAAALAEFDRWLPDLYSRMTSDDLLIVTADHGCDPTTPGTDHSREYVPLLLWSPALASGAGLGTRETFADVGTTIADNFRLSLPVGKSFLAEIKRCRSQA